MSLPIDPSRPPQAQGLPPQSPVAGQPPGLPLPAGEMPTPSIGTDGFSPSEANRSALLFPRPTWMLPQAQLLMFMEQLQQLFLNFRWPMWTPPHGSWPPVAMQPVYGAPLTNPPVPQAMYGAPYVGRPPFTMQPVYGAPLTNPPVPQAMYGAPSVGGAWPRDGAV